MLLSTGPQSQTSTGCTMISGSGATKMPPSRLGKQIQGFAGVMGLHLNDGTTGAVELSANPVIAYEFGPSDELPSGPATRGILKMGTFGTWAIGGAQVHTYTKELKITTRSMQEHPFLASSLQRLCCSLHPPPTSENRLFAWVVRTSKWLWKL